jgi:hypothetical protein
MNFMHNFHPSLSRTHFPHYHTVVFLDSMPSSSHHILYSAVVVEFNTKSKERAKKITCTNQHQTVTSASKSVGAKTLTNFLFRSSVPFPQMCSIAIVRAHIIYIMQISLIHLLCP